MTPPIICGMIKSMELSNARKFILRNDIRERETDLEVIQSKVNNILNLYAEGKPLVCAIKECGSNMLEFMRYLMIDSNYNIIFEELKKHHRAAMRENLLGVIYNQTTTGKDAWKAAAWLLNKLDNEDNIPTNKEFDEPDAVTQVNRKLDEYRRTQPES